MSGQQREMVTVQMTRDEAKALGDPFADPFRLRKQFETGRAKIRAALASEVVGDGALWFERNEDGRLEELRNGDEPTDAVCLFRAQADGNLQAVLTELADEFHRREQAAHEDGILEREAHGTNEHSREREGANASARQLVIDKLDAAPTQHPVDGERWEKAVHAAGVELNLLVDPDVGPETIDRVLSKALPYLQPAPTSLSEEDRQRLGEIANLAAVHFPHEIDLENDIAFLRNLAESSSGGETCARDSDWCDGRVCRDHGINCPKADPPRPDCKDGEEGGEQR